MIQARPWMVASQAIWIRLCGNLSLADANPQYATGLAAYYQIIGSFAMLPKGRGRLLDFLGTKGHARLLYL